MRRVCSECKAVNRVPVRHLADTGKCGKCRAALPPHAAPIEISSENQFDDIVAAFFTLLVFAIWRSF
mgnify:CR=1 FL=1